MNSFVSHLPAILQNAITMNDLEQLFLRSSITISLTPCSEKIKQKNEIEKNNNFVTCVSIPLAHAGNTAFETRRMTNARILFTTSPHSDIIENHRQKSLQKTEINTPMLINTAALPRSKN